jgi:hypothetical protein
MWLPFVLCKDGSGGGVGEAQAPLTPETPLKDVGRKNKRRREKRGEEESHGMMHARVCKFSKCPYSFYIHS